MKTVYALDMGGVVGTDVEYITPGKWRIEMTMGPEHLVRGDDGKTAWEQDATGHVRLLSRPEAAEQHTSTLSSLENYDPKKDSKDVHVTLRPQREPGTGDYIVDFKPTVGPKKTYYLDPHTFLMRRVITHKEDDTQTTEVLSYRRIAGRQVPAQIRISDSTFTYTEQLVRALPGVSLAASLFLPPEVARDFTFLTPTGTGPVTVPFEDDYGRIIIAVAVNGQTRHFLLDSGSGGSFLLGDAAQGLNLTTNAVAPDAGIGGSVKASLATHVTLELPGAVRITGQTLDVLQGQQAVSQYANGDDGSLGYNLFSRFIVTINYQKKTLTLADPDRFSLRPNGDDLQLPLRLDESVPSITASVDGRPPTRFLLDTGFNGTVHLFRAYAASHGLMAADNDPTAQRHETVGVGGTMKITVTPGHRLRLGGLTLTQVPLATGGGGLDEAGVIGYMVLHKFVVTFDYPHSRLILEKAPDFTPDLGNGAFNP